ncbi:hypothetical protein GCM10009646_67980 [Streptomyces aureus]
MAALTSVFPELYDDRRWMCLAVRVLITGVNLSGIVESARAVIVLTAFFGGSILVLIGVGLFRSTPQHGGRCGPSFRALGQGHYRRRPASAQGLRVRVQRPDRR